MGDWQAIPELVKRENVDLVVVALADVNADTKTELFERCRASEAEIKVLPNVYRDVLRGEGLGLLAELPI